MELWDTTQRVSREQLKTRCGETLRRLREYQRGARSCLAQRLDAIDLSLVGKTADLELFDAFLYREGPTGSLVRQRGYRACAAVWIDAVNGLMAALRDDIAVPGRAEFGAVKSWSTPLLLGDLVVLEPLRSLSRHCGRLLSMTHIPPERVRAELELQLAREERRRVALIDLLQRLQTACLMIIDLYCQSGFLGRALVERLRSLRAQLAGREDEMALDRSTRAGQEKLVDRLLEAGNRLEALDRDLNQLPKAWTRVEGEVVAAGVVRVHELDGRAGAALRSQMATLQLRLEGLSCGLRNVFARYGADIGSDVDETHQDTRGPRLRTAPSSGARRGPSGPGLVAGKPPETLEPSAPKVPVRPPPARASGSAAVGRSEAADREGGASGSVWSPNREPAKHVSLLGRRQNAAVPRILQVETAKCGGSKRGTRQAGARASKKVGTPRVLTVPQESPVARPWRVAWGNAEDGLWDWVGHGFAARFGRATLDGMLITQFDKTSSPAAVPGRFRSSDIPNWIEGSLGHHTLPRSNLVLFFGRDGCHITVVGVGGHAYDRRKHARAYNVFWWREGKGRAVGPKRIALQS